MKKDCAFQYALGRGTIVHDSNLITREDAEFRWDQHVEMFMSDLRAGLEPEMALWINMKDATSYGETAKHWSADEFIIADGKLYREVEL